MGELKQGAVVAITFPFSDLSKTKLRPALILAHVGRGDIVLCQITSKSYSDVLAVQISQQDFLHGGLPLTSYARPGKLFTAHDSLIVNNLGLLAQARHQDVVNAITQLLINSDLDLYQEK